MIRKTLATAFALFSLFVSVAQASAQAAVPDFQPFPRIIVPKIEGLPPELQQEFDKIQQEIDQVFNQGFGQPNRRATAPSAMTWGGMQLKKVSADEQEKLGLPENEGLTVAAVDANSVAGKAGLKAKDVLVKINHKAVSSEPTAFAKLVKEQNAAEPMELVVLRDGKEETIKNATMPAVVQMPSAGRPMPAFGGLQLQRFPLAIPGARINGRLPFENGLLGKPQNMNVEMTINGAKIRKRQNGDDFSGEYAKDELRITVAGKLENGVAKTSEITIQEGKATNKYKAVNEVPAPHRTLVQQLLPVTLNNFFFPLQQLQDLQNFPGLPVIPGIDN
jgi:membrane-associated protease RseP (regulator of RpoE activity)